MFGGHDGSLWIVSMQELNKQYESQKNLIERNKDNPIDFSMEQPRVIKLPFILVQVWPEIPQQSLLYQSMTLDCVLTWNAISYFAGARYAHWSDNHFDEVKFWSC